MSFKHLNEKPKTEYIIGEDESRRIQIMKLWLTIMVIFQHSDGTIIGFADGNVVFDVPVWLETVKYFISHIVVRTSVPGFFFLSGILLYKRSFRWKDNMKKKVRTLLIPYLIINTFWIVFYFAGQSIPLTSGYFSDADKIIRNWNFRDILAAYLGTRVNPDGTGSYPFVSPMWYIRDLIALNLLAPALKKAIDLLPRLVFVFITALLVTNISLHLFFLSCTALAYFCFGYYFIKYGRRLSDIDRIPAAAIAAAYAAMIAAYCLAKDTAVSELFRNLFICAGFVFFYRFTTRFKSNGAARALLWAAGYSFPIYLLHSPSLGILQKLSAKFLPNTAAVQALTYFGAPVVIFFACLAFSVLLERYLPSAYAILTGSRKPPVYGIHPNPKQ